MSSGYRHKDLSRSTWDGCCKLPIGNTYMLEEIGERFQGARCWLLEVAEVIYKLQEEHNDSDMNVSNLSGILPSHISSATK
ncbi:8752_t:CDS:2, partial [Ambispora gerdemannii]